MNLFPSGDQFLPRSIFVEVSFFVGGQFCAVNFPNTTPHCRIFCRPSKIFYAHNWNFSENFVGCCEHYSEDSSCIFHPYFKGENVCPIYICIWWKTRMGILRSCWCRFNCAQLCYHYFQFCFVPILRYASIRSRVQTRNQWPYDIFLPPLPFEL